MFTETKTPANDNAGIANASSAKTKTWIERVIFMMPLSYFPRENRACSGMVAT
jgi:hypothetical protein